MGGPTLESGPASVTLPGGKIGYIQDVGLANPIVVNYCNETASEDWLLRHRVAMLAWESLGTLCALVCLLLWVRLHGAFRSYYVAGPSIVRHASKTDWFDDNCNKRDYIAQYIWLPFIFNMTCLAWHLKLGFEFLLCPLDVLSINTWHAVNLPPRKNHTMEPLRGCPCVESESFKFCHVEELVFVGVDATYKWTTEYESHHLVKRFSSDRDVPAPLGVEDEWKAKQINHPGGRELPLIDVLMRLPDRCPFYRGCKVCCCIIKRIVMRHFIGGHSLSVVELECSFSRSPFDRSQFVKGLIFSSCELLWIDHPSTPIIQPLVR